MRIAMLHPCFWPEVRRGAERVDHDLAMGLLAAGHEVRLITSHPGRRTVAVENGLEIVRNPRPPDARLRARGFDDYLTHLPLTLAELARMRPDAVLASWPADAVVAARWARGRVPVIHHHMGVPDRDYLVQRRLRLETLLAAVRRSDVVVAISHAAAHGFERVLGVTPRVIHPGIDLQAFTPGGERAAEPTAFCAASTETPMKRVGLLVDAWPAVRARRPGARLVLMRPRDAELAAQLAAVDGVELIPNEPEQLLPAFRAAWLSALPSLGESFGLVLAESLACGTPVVATDHAAIPEVADRPAVARLFDRDDHPDGLVRALLEGFELAEDPATAAACRARAEDFSRERSAERFVELLREVATAR